MTLFQMAAAIAACDAAMILEGVDQATRERVLDRFGKSMAIAATTPQREPLDVKAARSVLRIAEVFHG